MNSLKLEQDEVSILEVLKSVKTKKVTLVDINEDGRSIDDLRSLLEFAVA